MNLDYLPDGGTGHIIPSQQSIDFWKEVKKLTNFKRMMEIGFNAGHSSAMFLTLFDDIQIDSYDICQFEVTKSNAEIVKKIFKHRFNFFEKDSMEIDRNDIYGKYDLIFIDGSHDLPFVENDFELALNSGADFLVADDLQNVNVQQTSKKLEKTNKIEKIVKGRYKASTGKWVPAECFKILQQ